MPILGTGDLCPCPRMKRTGRNSEVFSGPYSPTSTTRICAQEQTVKTCVETVPKPSAGYVLLQPTDPPADAVTSTGSKTKLHRMTRLICTKRPSWLSVSDDVTLPSRLGIRSFLSPRGRSSARNVARPCFDTPLNRCSSRMPKRI